MAAFTDQLLKALLTDADHLSFGPELETIVQKMATEADGERLLAAVREMTAVAAFFTSKRISFRAAEQLLSAVDYLLPTLYALATKDETMKERLDALSARAAGQRRALSAAPKSASGLAAPPPGVGLRGPTRK